MLVSESNPAVSDAFNVDDYSCILGIMERFYGLVLTVQYRAAALGDVVCAGQS